MKLWIKISGENRMTGAWFYDLEVARDHARAYEMLIPVEFPDWPDNVPDDSEHSGNGKLSHTDFPGLIDAAYFRGVVEGKAQMHVGNLIELLREAGERLGPTAFPALAARIAEVVRIADDV